MADQLFLLFSKLKSFRMINWYPFLCLVFLNPVFDNTESDRTFEPAFDIYEQRIDVIRQRESFALDDQCVTEDIPYHPVGIDLGNGLFFDLNCNLSLLINKLPWVENEHEFSVEKLNRFTEDLRSAFNATGDQICRERQGIFANASCQSIQRTADQVLVKRGNRTLVDLQVEDDAVISNHHGGWHGLEQKGNGLYQVHKRGRTRLFANQLPEGLLIGARNQYLIKSSGNTYHIYKVRGKRKVFQMKIEMDDHQYEIIPPRGRSTKIQFTDGRLMVLKGNRTREIMKV